LLRKQQKTLGGYFFLPHPVHAYIMLYYSTRRRPTAYINLLPFFRAKLKPNWTGCCYL